MINPEDNNMNKIIESIRDVAPGDLHERAEFFLRLRALIDHEWAVAEIGSILDLRDRYKKEPPR